MEKKELSKEDQALLDLLQADQMAREKAFLESWGASPNERTAASFAYKAFIEKEQRGQTGRSFYAVPLARKSFMIGWILAHKEIKAGGRVETESMLFGVYMNAKNGKLKYFYCGYEDGREYWFIDEGKFRAHPLIRVKLPIEARMTPGWPVRESLLRGYEYLGKL